MDRNGIGGKRNLWQRIRKGLVPVLLMAALLVPAAVSTEDSFADILVWHSVNMEPGDTYDVSKAKWNTTVFIKSAGDYTLEGKSESVRVMIESGGVNLYLADGLNINCSGHSYTGSRTAAIWVRDTGGTVTLISKKNAMVTLEGYMCPAIRKEGTDTKLVFETEDPNAPGTINANSGSQSASNGRDPAAIGSMDFSTGNITFNSGNVIARIRGLNSCAAAIGGAEDGNVSNITINGGHIEAYGSEYGAAIGGGAKGVFTGFYVNGGEVYAENKAVHDAGGAAIGGGDNDIDTYHKTPGNIGAKDFYFKGGTVTALSHGAGAAIGGGFNSGCSNINIEGGTVSAICDSTESKYNYEGAGIGGGYGYQISTEVNISGGTVTAKGGYGAPGIGSQDSDEDPEGKTKDPDTGTYRISGGTIYAQCGDNARGDIGTRASKMIITGGNLHALSHAGDAVNGNGEEAPVHRVEVSFDGITDDGHAISDLAFQPMDYPYGMNDVVTMGGKFHIWLPNRDDMYLTRASLDSNGSESKYQGSIPFTAKAGTMSPGTLITLELGSSGTTSGSALAMQGGTSLEDMVSPTFADNGFKVSRFFVSGTDKAVAEADGTLIKDVQGYTDADGKWIYDGGNDLTLIGRMVAITYKVRFDANVPRHASTQCSGEMADETFTYSTAKTLTKNSYDLPGYEFDCWKTDPEGTGDGFKDRATIDKSNQDKLAPDKDGAVVTLYAQWKPKTYTITYSDGLGGGGSSSCPVHTQENIEFDTPGRLDLYTDEAFGWEARTNKSSGLHGWYGPGSGSLYDDNASFVNLCEMKDGKPVLDEHGGLVGETLTAEWAEAGKIRVSVTNDGVTQEGLALYLTLTNMRTGTIYFKAFSQVGSGSSTTYVYDPGPSSFVPEGKYILSFDTSGNPDRGIPAGPSDYLPASVEIDYGGAYAASTVFDYYTVSIGKDPAQTAAIASVAIADAEGIIEPSADGKIFAPDGRRLNIQTSIKEGYHFDGYSAAGVIPGSKDDSGDYDASKPDQTITVRGTADIMAHAEANVYKVHFDANAVSGVSGEMPDQDMVYDEPQDLFANKFTRPGGSFAIWTTNEDGSGDQYEDAASVKGLTAEAGGMVTLYAQWNMTTFNIDYDLNGGQLPAGKTNPDRYWADSAAFTLNEPVKEDYNFLGWVGTGLSGPTETVTVEEGSLGDRKYVATWAMKYYHVYFEEKGGSAVEPEIVKIHDRAAKPQDPTRDGYDFAGWYQDAGLTTAYDFDQEITADTTLYAKWEPAKVPVVMAKARPSGAQALKVSWTKVNGAAKYLVYAAPCEKKLKLVKKTAKNGFTLKRIKAKKLKAHKPYVLCVAAVGKDGKVIAKSKKFHVITAGTMGKYANVTKIKAKKKQITLEVGNSKKVSAACTLPKGKKHLNRSHGAKLQYTSNNPLVASVNKKGMVKALEPGKATIYIQDTNGMYCKTVVTVK